MKPLYYKYYLTYSTPKQIKEEGAWLYEEYEEDSRRNVYCRNMNLAKHWLSIKEMRKEIDFSTDRFGPLNIIVFDDKNNFVKVDHQAEFI